MDDEQLRRIGWRGIAAFQRSIGRHAPESRLTEAPAYVASAVPSVSASLVNAAVPIDAAPVAPHLDDLAAFYADTPKWGVWIDPGVAEDVEALARHGLVRDSNPVLMAAELAQIASPGRLEVERAEMADVGAVNNLAYGMADSPIGRALSAFPSGALHAYGTRVDGTLASVLLIEDVGDDAFVTMVATLPEHRGKRLASKLLAHALDEAGQRGLETTSLQASELGQNVYARLGYRPLGEVHLYEKRPA